LIAVYGVWALDGVSYIDANGEQQIVNSVTAISSDGGEITLNTGWYIMQGTFTNSGRITINGTVNLILANGSNVTVNAGTNWGADGAAGINVSVGNSFSIYAQSTGNNIGKLTVTGNCRSGYGGAGIGGNGIFGEYGTSGSIDASTTSAGTLTLNGNAIVFANSVSDTDVSRRRKGILFIGNTGTFYGTSVTLGRDAAIPSGGTLTIPANATLTIPTGCCTHRNSNIQRKN